MTLIGRYYGVKTVKTRHKTESGYIITEKRFPARLEFNPITKS